MLALLASGCPQPQAPSPAASPPASSPESSAAPSRVEAPAPSPVPSQALPPEEAATPSPPQKGAPVTTRAEPSQTPAPSRPPLRGPSSPTDLAGLWVGRRITLVLRQEGSGYQGTLTLRKRELPIEVERGPKGWGGVLVQGEREAEFSLARKAGGLVLSADGRSYELESVEVGAGIVGTYRGPRETTLALGYGTTGYAGSLSLDGVDYVLRGQEAEGGYLGTLRDPLTGKELTWTARAVDEDSLLFTIRLEDQQGDGRASFHALRFERSE